MNIAIIGLGLIGGSFARAIKSYTGHRVMCFNRTVSVARRAIEVGAADELLTGENLPSCDLVIVSLYPAGTVKWITENRGLIKKGALVIDCCGVKRSVAKPLEEVSRKSGFTFIGAHPMAGIERSGFEHSSADMFKGASLIITPYVWTPGEDISRLRDLAISLGFGGVQVSDPEEHDRLIAYTSQLAHVVSCAYVSSPSAPNFRGFSAGSFHDMTRVARLNEHMWAELFIDNKDFLCSEIEDLAKRLLEYSDAIRSGERKRLETMLGGARSIKEQIDPIA
ncbi:MAG: prephenate dehydrogenase [Oscillospiraceae bacterium]|jgi:prephenate dehydrogenase